ncbi:PD40 domain-containing protein, partial [Streptomyces sp. FH025]|nr:PD40 domain-containing protein [Streptomyces sp. FH025]
MIGATGTPRSIRRPARAAAAVLLALATALVTLGSAAPEGQGSPTAQAAAADPAAGRIVYAGTNHRGLGRVTGAADSSPLFGPGPIHFDQDPSARGGELVFTSLRDGPLPQVYLRDAAGAVHRLTTGMDTAHPALAPDGKGVVFEALEPRGDGGSQHVLWAVNRDGSGLRRITDGAADETHPTVSPDGKWIAYACTGQPGHIQIFLRPFGGGAPVKISNVTSGDAIDPTWNPVDDDEHRNQIVYTWDQGDKGRTLILTSPTGGEKAFFPGTGSTWRTGSASWLADGTGVLFLSADRLTPAPPGPPTDPAQPPVVNLYRAPTCSCTEPQLLYSTNRLIAAPTWLGTQAEGGPVVEQASASAANVADLQDIRPDGADPRDLGVSILREDPAAVRRRRSGQDLQRDQRGR